MAEDPPRWRKWGALALALLVAAAVVLDWHRIKSDLLPLDKSSVGPNLLASVVQWTVIVIIGVLIWPPTRRRIHAFADRKLGMIHSKIDVLRASHIDLHEKIDRLHERHDQHHEHLTQISKAVQELHEKLDTRHQALVPLARVRVPKIKEEEKP